MSYYHAEGITTVLHGDCLNELRTIPDNSIDAVVTDPPYGLSNTTPAQVTETITRWVSGDREYLPSARGFMGHEWDGFVPPVAVWDECLRVLKPGGHLIAFAGSRTQDLMGLAVRLAGFEIRDSIYWHYGSGFPKSHNVTKALRGKVCDCPVPYTHDNVSHEGVRNLPDGVAADDALPVSPESNLLPEVRERDERTRTEGEARAQRSADRDSVCRVRGGCADSAGVGEAECADVLLPEVQREGARPGMGQVRCGGGEATEGPVRRAEGREEPRLEGRRDVWPTQGELHRPQVCEVPRGMADDGPEGRVHHGASAGHGSVDRQAVGSDGSGESHQPRPSGQSAGESGAVPVERGSQAWRGWPVCARCGKPSIPDGLGTALKPATEPVILARKPMSSTVAANVLEHGTGALNIDGCRIGTETRQWVPRLTKNANLNDDGWSKIGENAEPRAATGRWPANVVLDESQAAELDRQVGPVHWQATNNTRKSSGWGVSEGKDRRQWDAPKVGAERLAKEGPGLGPSKFFYVAKAPKSERPSYTPPVLRLRDDLTPEQVDHVRARLAEAGVQVD